VTAVKKKNRRGSNLLKKEKGECLRTAKEKKSPLSGFQRAWRPDRREGKDAGLKEKRGRGQCSTRTKKKPPVERWDPDGKKKKKIGLAPGKEEKLREGIPQARGKDGHKDAEKKSVGWL